MNHIGPLVGLAVIAVGIWQIVKTRNEVKDIERSNEETRLHIEEIAKELRLREKGL